MQNYVKPISTHHRSKSSHATRLAPRKRLGPILITLIVIIITAVILRRVIFSEIQPATVSSIEKRSTHTKQTVEDATNKAKNTRAPQTTTQHPRFAFYNMLPKMQVEMMTVEVPTPTIGKRLSPTSTEKIRRYILQIASFRERTEARRLQKQLEKNTQLNLHIDEVDVAGITWYRVQLGPFNDLKRAQAEQQLLQENYSQSFIRHYAKNQQ